MMPNTEKTICDSVIKIDDSIRFVGLISDGGKLIEFSRNTNAVPLLDDEQNQLSLIQAALRATMHKAWDNALGKTRWTIALKDKVKLITMFLDPGLLAISTEINSDHDTIIRKINELI